MRKFAYCVTAAAVSATAVPAVAFDALEGRKSRSEILAATTDEDWREIPAEDLLLITLERGVVAIMLSQNLAQGHVAQARTLAREKFFDGLSFYRVIDGFVAQGGDPFEERPVGSASKALKAEFETKVGDDFSFQPTPDADVYAPKAGFSMSVPTGVDAGAGKAWHLHCAGAFAFGRNDAADTASTEFYIALQPQRYLDRNLSVAGRVVDGMEHLQALRRVEPPEAKEDDRGETILSVMLASDIPEAQRPRFEILDSSRPAFLDTFEALRNRPEAFFHYRPGVADVCQFNVPVRRKATK
jgi:peptidylprolyl isomerase